jgi:hypothetical protein
LEKFVASGGLNHLRDNDKAGPFLEEISIPVDGSLAEEPAQRFLRLVNSHGYWLASAEENAAVGLDVNWGAARD